MQVLRLHERGSPAKSALTALHSEQTNHVDVIYTEQRGGRSQALKERVAEGPANGLGHTSLSGILSGVNASRLEDATSAETRSPCSFRNVVYST